MPQVENKDHWYDGWFYDALVAPRLDGLFSRVGALIEPGSAVVDIGCGTGRLVFSLAGKCGSVLGIDLSRRNIERAGLLLARKPDARITFRHGDAGALLEGSGHYRYAVMTLMLHEMDEAERLDLLRKAAAAADRVIVGEHLVPVPGFFLGALVNAVEFGAGLEHYRNYRSFVRGGGLRGLAALAGLKIVSETRNQPPAVHLAVLEKNP